MPHRDDAEMEVSDDENIRNTEIRDNEIRKTASAWHATPGARVFDAPRT